MFKYIMILVFGLSLSLPVAVQAGTSATVAVIKCCCEEEGSSILVASTSANGGIPGACSEDSQCAGCIQALLDFSLNLEQTNVAGTCSWYHFFEDRDDRKDSDR